MCALIISRPRGRCCNGSASPLKLPTPTSQTPSTPFIKLLLSRFCTVGRSYFRISYFVFPLSVRPLNLSTVFEQHEALHRLFIFILLRWGLNPVAVASLVPLLYLQLLSCCMCFIFLTPSFLTFSLPPSLSDRCVSRALSPCTLQRLVLWVNYIAF